MDMYHVTLAIDDEKNKNHTQIFLNRNLFQCYHNNRGYCSFKDKCRYQHYLETCSKTVCRDKECKKYIRFTADIKMIANLTKQTGVHLSM